MQTPGPVGLHSSRLTRLFSRLPLIWIVESVLSGGILGTKPTVTWARLRSLATLLKYILTVTQGDTRRMVCAKYRKRSKPRNLWIGGNSQSNIRTKST